MASRTYDSPRRSTAAAETREAILGAALRLFETRGYAATGMGEVATEAGVSLNTVYVSVGKKPQLLIALFRDASEDADIEATLEAIGAVESPQELIAALAAGTRVVFERYDWALGALYDNASASDEISEALDATETHYRDRVGQAARRLAELRPRLEAERTTQILWFYFGFRPWRELRGLGWGWDDIEHWLADQASNALLGGGAS